ncbi:MAG: helix-turn-helix transcriptional regulator [Trueperaceae bacterium]
MSDEDYLSVVRNRIQTARISKELRQEDMADLLGMSVRSYQRYEGASTLKLFNPYLTTLRRIAVALEVDIARLVGEPSPRELEDLRTKPQRQRVRRSWSR